MNEQIKKVNGQTKKPGLLELVGQGDADAAKELHKLVKRNCISKNQLPMIFCVATKTAADLKEEVEILTKTQRPPVEKARREIHSLACQCAWKMTVMLPEYTGQVHEKFMFAINNPDKVNIDVLKDLGLAEMVFIGQRIVKNGTIIQIAEAIADGIPKTRDEKKRTELLRIGEAVRSRMPDDISLIYSCVFELAKNPNNSCECTWNVILGVHLQREDEKTDPNITVIKRIRSTLKGEEKPKPKILSDGDTKLPRQHIISKPLLDRAKQMPPPVTKRGQYQLAFARRS